MLIFTAVIFLFNSSDVEEEEEMFREAEEEEKKEQEDLQRRWTYAMEMTMKSSQFQGSRRNVKLSIAKPRATILVRDSKV